MCIRDRTEVDAAVTAVRDAIEKLQEKPPVQKEFTITAVAHGGGTIDPVSYTHLDVYKRQELYEELMTLAGW